MNHFHFLKHMDLIRRKKSTILKLSYEIFQYFEPWICRKYLTINHEWNAELNDILHFIDEQYKKREQRTESLCHNAWNLKHPYDYSLIMTHDCTTEHPNERCHRTNEFGSVHWDITSYWVRPNKCIECGTVFLNRNTVKQKFFLNDKDIANTTRYISTYDYRSVSFNKQEIQWCALMKYGTIAPLYIPSKARSHRENMVNAMLTKDAIPHPFTFDSLKESLPFRFYAQGKWKINITVLHMRYRLFLKPFLEFYNECVRLYPNVVFFSDMTGLTVQSHGFSDLCQKSLSWFLGISIFENDLSKGLNIARTLIIETYKRQNHPILSKLTPYFVSSHQRLDMIINQFKDGLCTLNDVIDEVSTAQSIDNRRIAIHRFLHQHGIHYETLECSTMQMYIDENSVPRSLVLQCMINHVKCSTNCKNCMV